MKDKNGTIIKENDKFKTGVTETIFIIEKLNGELFIDGTPLKKTAHTWGEIVH